MNTLAQELLVLARKSKGVDGAANTLLSTVKKAGLTTLDALNEAVRTAYAVNGWSQTAGRPVAGSKLKPAPDAVKLVLSTFRTALKLGLPLAEYQTVYQVREAVKKHSTAAAHGPEPRPALVGVVLRSSHSLIGSLWHDAIIMSEAMPEKVQLEFEEEVQSLLERFRQFLPADLLQQAPAAAAA